MGHKPVLECDIYIYVFHLQLAMYLVLIYEYINSMYESTTCLLDLLEHLWYIAISLGYKSSGFSKQELIPPASRDVFWISGSLMSFTLVANQQWSVPGRRLPQMGVQTSQTFWLENLDKLDKPRHAGFFLQEMMDGSIDEQWRWQRFWRNSKQNTTVRVPGFWRQCAIFCFLKSSAPLWLRNRVQGGDFRKVLSRMQLI